MAPYRHWLILPLGLILLSEQSTGCANPITTLPTVEVKSQPVVQTGSTQSGYRTSKVSAGALGEQNIKESPFSIEPVSGEQIENLQATTTSEALRYVATVQNNTGSSRITDYYSIRGFSASVWTYNMALDGMRTFDIVQPLEDKQRIEVLSGANSFLYGMTSTAGMVNFVSKQPTATPFTTISTGNAGGSQLYAQIDSGGPLGASSRTNYRTNLLYGDKGTNGISQQTNERYLLSGSVDWHLDPDNTLGMDAALADRDLAYAQTIFMPSVKSGIPSAVSGKKNWGAPYSYSKDHNERIGLRFGSEISPRTRLRSQVRYSEVTREFLMTRQVWQNSDLDYKQRIDFQKQYSTTAKQANLYVDHYLETGLLLHKFTLGGSYDHVGYDYPVGGNGSGTSTTIYAGNLHGEPGYAPYFSPPAATATSRKSIYQTALLADEITLTPQWSTLLGSSYVNVRDDSWNSATGSSSNHYDEGAFTPNAALIYKPVADWMTYLSYTEALQQGFVAPQTAANAGEVSSPYVGRQYELGTKGSVGDLDLTAAYFHITQATQLVENNRYGSDGEEVHKGWEATGRGLVTKAWTLGGGITLFDAKITRSTTAQDKTPSGVAEQMGRLFTEYQLAAIPGLTLTGGLSYTSDAWVDTANTLSIPSYTLLDAGWRYNRKLANHDLTVLFNANNLSDKHYWTTRSGILYLGTPATYSLSGRLAF